MITYKQIDPDNIQTSELNNDGSFTSGIINRFAMRTRTNENGEIESYSPWYDLILRGVEVEMLDIDAWQANENAQKAKSKFKRERQSALDSSEVNANGFLFNADEVSINRMGNAIIALSDELDAYILQWSLADTDTGIMTDITLADLKLAHQLAVQNMANVWSVE